MYKFICIKSQRPLLSTKKNKERRKGRY